MNELGNIKVGQCYVMNRPRGQYYLHVLGIAVDMLGKYKVTVQVETPMHSQWRKRHFYSAKLVSPQYFFGLTVKVEEPANAKK